MYTVTEEQLREKVRLMIRDLAEYEDEFERQFGPMPMSPEEEEMVKAYFPDSQE